MTIMFMAAVILIVSGISVSAAPRVLAEVTAVTDHSARISLGWDDGPTGITIMITSWKFTDEGLVVYYSTGENVPEGYASRTLSHERHTFPMKIRLERSVNHTPEFTDINDHDPGRSAILNLYYRGIIGGYPDGSFKAENKVTRAEFSKMLLLTAGYAEADNGSSMFSDVTQDYWGRKYIIPLAEKGILKGKGEGIFDPNGQIKIGEVVTVLTRTFDLYGTSGSYPYLLTAHWSNEYFVEGVRNGIVTSADSFYRHYDAEMPATREQCAILLSRVLEHLHDVTE